MSADSSGKISLALGASKKPRKPAPTNGVKRSHAALQDHEEEENQHGRAQTVSHFDKSAGGAFDEVKPKEEKGALVIKPQANRDWKEASQRNKLQRSGKSSEAHRGLQNVFGGDGERLEGARLVFGLDARQRTEDKDATATNGHAALDEAEQNQQTPPEPNGDAPVRQKTEDEEAMDALLGKTTKTDLVLPALTEEEAFERDYKQAPDMATLDDYARVPVEEFGAALLRGMGWKDGEGIGSNRAKKVEKTKMPERRPALLGIGAKEEAAVAQELGTWGKAAKDRKGPAAPVYNPVLLRDRKTGELFTEEELEKKKARDERERYEMEFERKEKERRRKDRGDSRERKEKERRREKRDDRDRDRTKYDDSDEEYYRRKAKEKRRRERERGDGDYDRERAKRHDSDRARQRDRDRHRDRR